MLPHKPPLLVHGNNQEMLCSMDSGTHGVCMAWLSEVFQRGDVDLVYERTTRMCTDIDTKAFVDVQSWESAQTFIIDPSDQARRSGGLGVQASKEPVRPVAFSAVRGGPLRALVRPGVADDMRR